MPRSTSRVLRIGFLDEIPDGDTTGCGSRRVMTDLVQGLSPDRFQPVVFVPRTGAFSRQLEQSGAQVVPLPFAPLVGMYRQIGGRLVVPDPTRFARNLVRLPVGILSLAAMFRRHRLDVAYLSTPLAHVEGAMAGRLAGVPTVAHIQGFLQARQRIKLLRPVYRAWCAAGGTRMVAISNAVADSVVQDGPGRPRVIFNGTDTSVFRPGRPDPDRFQELGLPLESGPIVGVISRVVPGKRLNLLPRLAAAVFSRRPDARFLICGAPDDPDEFARIRAALAASGIAHNVVFAGHRDDLPELLHGFSVLAHLIVLEGFGLAVTEAMASGVPPVVFGGGGPAEVVEHGTTGFVVQAPDDVEVMAGHIVDLLNSPEAAATMGARAREAVESRFSVQRFVSEFDDLFTSLARSPE